MWSPPLRQPFVTTPQGPFQCSPRPVEQLRDVTGFSPALSACGPGRLVVWTVTACGPLSHRWWSSTFSTSRSSRAVPTASLRAERMSDQSHKDTLHFLDAHIDMLHNTPIEHPCCHLPTTTLLLSFLETPEDDSFTMVATVCNIWQTS